MTDSAIELIARGVLRKGQHLLVCRNVEQGYVYLPGGHVEFGESAQRALEREFLEETGLSVEAGACGLVTESLFEQRGEAKHEYSLVFHVEHQGSMDLLDGLKSRESHIAFDWVDLAAVGDLDLRPVSVRAWLVTGAPCEGDFFVPTPH
jgi:8-oxo-dGTP diphosphatase